MTVGFIRFEKELDLLILRGDQLDAAMVRDVEPDQFLKQVKEQLKDKEIIATFLKRLPDFKIEYEAWYSESLALLRQLLPDRVANFVSFYEKPKGRKSTEYGNYVIQDYLQNLVVTYAGDPKVGPRAAVPQFRQQLAILKAAKSRFKSSLYEMRQLVQADVFDREIDAARELLKNKFLRASGAIAGVVLEKHLLQVCSDHSIKVTKKDPGISDLNDLLKAASTIEVSQWRHISMLGDLRNLCVHNKKKEPTEAQVTDLIDGTDKVLKTIS